MIASAVGRPGAWFVGIVIAGAIAVGIATLRQHGGDDRAALPDRAVRDAPASAETQSPPLTPSAEASPEPRQAGGLIAAPIEGGLELPDFERDPAYLDEEGRPSRALVRNALELAIEEHYPSHKLSEDEVERVTDAMLRMREARLALAELPEDEDLAPLRRELVQTIEDAGREFAEVMDMGLETFTEGAEGGVDRFDPDAPIPEPEFLPERTP